MLKGEAMSAALPDIHLRDIGKQKGGADPSEVVEILVRAISQSSVKAVGTLDLNKLVGSATESVAGMKGQIEGATAGTVDAKSVGGALNKMLGDK